MILLMRKYLIILFIFLVKFSFAKAEIVNSINIKGNERIAKETIVIFSAVNIGDDLIINDLKQNY
jgi:outer membrane protein assembly factor BamA